MKNKLFGLITVFSLAVCSIFANQNALKQVSQAYFDGEYDDFLKDLQGKYEKALEKKKIGCLPIEQWENLYATVDDQAFYDFQHVFQEKMRSLAAEEPSHPLSSLIQTAFPVFSKEDEKKIQFIESFAINREGKSALEKTVVELKKEKLHKMMLISFDLCTSDLKEEEKKTDVLHKTWVLELNFLRKMKEKADQLNDEKMSQLIQDIITKNEASFEIQAIAKKSEPLDKMEERIHQCFSEYEKKCIEGMMK